MKSSKASHNLIIRITVSFIIFILSTKALAETREENAIYAFAENLFLGKDYYRAITEYKRLLFYFPGSHFVPDAKFKIAKSYQLGGKYSIAADKFRDIVRQYENKRLGLLAEFESAECLYRTGDYIISLDSYKKFTDDEKFKQFKDMATYRTGLARLHLKQTEKARQAFSNVSPESDFFAFSTEMIDKTRQFENLKRKSPFLAGILSTLIPGTGQFYNGRVKDGIIALITNGLFIWGSYEAYRREYYSLGIVASIFAFGWYTGNIYGAVNGAHRYNFQKEKDFFEDLKPKHELLDWGMKPSE